MTAMSSSAISCLVCACLGLYIKTKIGEFAANATVLYFYFLQETFKLVVLYEYP